MSSLSVLQRATKANVKSDPFPHVVVRNALPEALYEELAASFPPIETITNRMGKNNRRFNYGAPDVRKNPRISQLWKDFIAYHASQAFLDEIVELLGDDYNRLYPERFPTRDSLRLRAGLREVEPFGACDVQMDALLAGNTPVKEASSVRSSHVDRGDKLFSGLFYMRPDDYDAVGGDLTLSRFKPEVAGDEKRLQLFDAAYVEDRHLDVADTIVYDKNLLVLFINSVDSVHGVTIRQPSDKTRIFINLVGEIEKPLYIVNEDGGPVSRVPDGYVKPALHKPWFKRIGQLLKAS